MVRVQGKKDGAKDRRNLYKNFESSRDLRLGWRSIFQQNSDPKHIAESTLYWFKENSLNGLNPIENLWFVLRIVGPST